MKIVDKYQLALEPANTPFYVLNEYGGIGKGCEKGLLILEGGTFYTPDNKPMFNGVTYLEPDTEYGNYIEGELPTEIEFSCYDTDSNDFDDNDRFLVLNKKELKSIIDFLQECYDNLKEE